MLSVYYYWIPEEGCPYIKQWMTSRISSTGLMPILRRMWLDRWWLLLQHLNLTLKCQWYSSVTSWNLWGGLSLCWYQFKMVCQINREDLIVPTTLKYQWSKCLFWNYFVLLVLFLLQHREGRIEHYFIRDEAGVAAFSELGDSLVPWLSSPKHLLTLTTVSILMCKMTPYFLYLIEQLLQSSWWSRSNLFYFPEFYKFCFQVN